MAQLLTTLQIREVAFDWSGTKRVYRAQSLRVSSREDREDFEFSDGNLNFAMDGVWLFFEVSSDYFQRLSPSGDNGNTAVDLRNALNDPAITVDFFPIHDVDDTISLTVVPDGKNRDLLNTRKGMFSPSVRINCRAKSRQSDYPAWLEITRSR